MCVLIVLLLKRPKRSIDCRLTCLSFQLFFNTAIFVGGYIRKPRKRFRDKSEREQKFVEAMDMEETQIQNPKPISFSLSPRRHLQSKTYRTLVRIFSHCYDESQHPLAAHVHNDLRTGRGFNLTY